MITPPEPEINNCAGPLIWYDIDGGGAVLECACGFVCCTGNFLDEEHAGTPLLKEGLAA